MLASTRDKEWLGCNVCGRAFYGTVVIDEPAHPEAPRGICHGCQENPRR